MEAQAERSPEGLAALAALVHEMLTLSRGSRTAADFVRSITAADELEHASRVQLRSAVLAARANGVSWQTIGDALGISRQSAFKRFGSPTTPIGEDYTSMPVVDLAARTENVFHSLNKGDFASVKSLMTFTCARLLPKKKVMALWSEVVAATGQLESVSDTVVQTRDGRTIGMQLWNELMGAGVVGQTQLNNEAGEWTGRVAYSSSGKIEGILIVTPGTTNLPF
jgi:hypothetical protein